ncbi:Bulb-type lectin domain containing protein [Trema orientale]|uniref:Bulb-type lectin domain containing protein n=1 Tax=Trema orientale TaxID=63057 RepID=A0A2P5BCM3_TREOI|nr:Bulb-type lectin domain containing protein [Trema orientale]
MAKLLNIGDLVLLDQKNTAQNLSTDDPGIGNCSYQVDPSGCPQLYLCKGGAPWWRATSWTGHGWSGVPTVTPNFIFNVSFVNNRDEVTIVYGLCNDSIFSRMTIDKSGTVHRSTWRDQGEQWPELWPMPIESCNNYEKCGPNGYCDPSNKDKF